MKLYKIVIASVLLIATLYAQPPTRISWSGKFNCERCSIDSVRVINKSSGEKFVFRYPDTAFMCGDVGITTVNPEGKTNLRVYPNPFSGNTQVDFSLPQSGEVDMTVFDLLGREVIRQNRVLEKGTHSVKIRLPQGIYTLSLQTAEGLQSARLLSEGKENAAPQIVYSGSVSDWVDIPKKVHKSNDTVFPFGKFADKI